MNCRTKNNSPLIDVIKHDEDDADKPGRSTRLIHLLTAQYLLRMPAFSPREIGIP
jgi:hypothetical protein